MPFNPRFIHPDDAPVRADGELDLPPDLAELAEQLADDAAHLSTRFPANRASHVALAAELVDSAERIKSAGQEPDRQGRHRAMRAAALIAGGGLATLAAIGLTLSLASRPLDFRHAPASVSTLEYPVHEADSAPSPIPASLAAPAVATLSLGELSAPEMEALFDLLQRDPGRTSSVSF